MSYQSKYTGQEIDDKLDKITELPIASDTTLGGIKVGNGLEITEDGILSALSSKGDITTLFSGKASTANSTSELSDSIKNYDFILVTPCVFGKSGNEYKNPFIINTKNVIGDNSNEFVAYSTSDPLITSYCYSIRFGFSTDGNSLLLGYMKKGTEWSSTDIGIESVYGIKLGSRADSQIYSQEETKIGTWIDGKPIYRKVITGYKMPNINATTNITLSELNIDIFTEIKIFQLDNKVFGQVPSGSSNEFIKSNYWYIRDEGILYIDNINSKAAGREIECIIEYTKTTD